MRMRDCFIYMMLLFGSGIALASNPATKKNNDQTIIPYRLSETEKAEGYQLLFDGTSLDDWIDNSNEYEVQNGCIVKKASGFGNLYSVKKYCDFILKFEFQLTPGANNGLGIRHFIMPVGKGYMGMELQILDDSSPLYENLKPYQYHGGLYNYAPAERGHLKAAGEWNYQEVIVKGSDIKIILNGAVILDVNIKKLIKNIPIDKVQAGLRNPCGHIAFLGHDSVVRFRYIRIKALD